jgi:RNA polymerase sigma factor (sigma-70 family)
MKDHEAERRWERIVRLLEPIHEQALSTARNLSRRNGEGDDLYQEAVLRAWRKLHTLREEERFRPWFFAVLLSVHRSRCRRAFWKRLIPFEDASPADRDPVGEDGRVHAEELDAARRAARALARLPGPQREALVLHELEGFSMEEIAAMQKASVAAVKSRVFRARERLRRHYRALGFGDGAAPPEPVPRREGRSSNRIALSPAEALVPAYSSAVEGQPEREGRHE